MQNEQIPGIVDRAFEAMISGRSGPAALAFPQDLMAMPGETTASASCAELRRTAPSPDSILQVIELLQHCERPVILVGGGGVLSGAAEQVEELGRRLDCPIITTVNGKGILDERLPSSFGHGRTRRARIVLSRADLMIAVGCRFTEVFTASGTIAVPKKLIQIDIDPKQIGTNYPVEVGIVGDARTVLRGILSALPNRQSVWRETWQRARHMEQLKPEWVIETLRAALPDSSMVFSDACEMGLRMQLDFPAFAPRTFFYPSNFAALGWGFPAAIGGAVGQPDRWTACVCGDGGFLMTAQELATATRYNLKLITVIHNDSTYGAIKAIQRTKHESRYLDTDLNNPDFVKFGESFGVPSRRAHDANEFAEALELALHREGPSLIEVPSAWRSLRM